MAARKKSTDLDKYFDTLKDRYFRYLKYLFDKNYAIADHKEAFMKICIGKARAQYMFYTTDQFTNGMVELFKERYNLKRPMKETLTEVHNIRKFWKKQQDHGLKTSTPFEPVYETFVAEEHDTKIVKWIIRYVVTVYFYATELAPNKSKYKGASLGREDKTIKPEKVVFSFKFNSKTNPEGQSEELFRGLVNLKMISPTKTTLRTFKNAFRGGVVKNPILWFGKLSDLTYLIDELSKRCFEIPLNLKSIVKLEELEVKDRKAISNWVNPKINTSFRDSKGNSFSPQNFKDARTNYQNKKVGVKKPTGAVEIDALIKNIARIK